MLAHGLLWLPDLPLEYAGLDMVSKQQKNSNHAIVLWIGMPFWSQVQGAAILLFHLGSRWCCCGLRDARKDELGTGGYPSLKHLWKAFLVPSTGEAEIHKMSRTPVSYGLEGLSEQRQNSTINLTLQCTAGPVHDLATLRQGQSHWTLKDEDSELEEEGLKSVSSKARNVNQGPRSESGPF